VLAFGAIETPIDVIAAVRWLIANDALAAPLPGSGRTATRLRTLSEIAARDLSVARIAEGHLDARAILAEAGAPVREGLYGVWAADAADARVTAVRDGPGWRLRGRKRYASGARGLDRALITAASDDGDRLFDVALGAGLQPVPDTWQAVGMAATESLDVELDAGVPAAAAIGAPGFYLERPGFWHGAVGVAACWYGGALGAYRMLCKQLRRTPPSEHQAAHLGAVAATCRAMQLALDAAAHEIDAAPRAPSVHGRLRALYVRQLVEQGCQDVLARVGRASGTWPLAFDRAHARRAADLIVYLRQHHAERDLAALGHAVLEAACD